MSVTSLSARIISRPEFIALVAGLMCLNSLAIDVMLPALPYMGVALGVESENERQLVIAAYMLGFGVAQLAFGPLSDRFGRRNPLLIGIVVYVLAAGCAILAPNFFTLLFLRVIQGMGAAGTRVIATSAIRDRYSGRDMAQVMSLSFMVFMVLPVIAPGIGQVILFAGPWQYIFAFMAILATVIGVWVFLRLPETLSVEHRRPLTVSAVLGGFRLVFTNRVAFSYGLAGMFMFGGLFGFISSSQQIYVDIYGLGPYFPVAFAAMASLMSLSNYFNSRFVQRLGMRRLSHGAMLIYMVFAITLTVGSHYFQLPLIVFFLLVAGIMFMFGFAASNMNSLSMEPLGEVAGTASAVFGFIQTVGGAIIGSFIGQSFNGTVTPVALGYLTMGIVTLICVLIAEKGRLFGVGEQYAHGGAVAADFGGH
jgi:DHA1 family bicyclomycin/chloramphenicol resistance-like MFS transporter